MTEQLSNESIDTFKNTKHFNNENVTNYIRQRHSPFLKPRRIRRQYLLSLERSQLAMLPCTQGSQLYKNIRSLHNPAARSRITARNFRVTPLLEKHSARRTVAALISP